MENKPLLGDKDHHAPASSETLALPYEILPGEGLNSFELLCFRVLMAEKNNPHFFARSGQDDYGVDITVEKKGDFTVFQCKNLKGSKKKFNESDFKKAFADFNDNWIKEQKMQIPQQFIYCTSARIGKDNDSHSAFRNAKKDFKEQFLKDWDRSIEVNFWDSDTLDEKLKKYPDIVAEMFGSEWAARHCRFYGWDSDLFINIKEDLGKSLFLKEYFKKKHRIYIPQDKRENLEERLKKHGNILIRGFPGTGKTFLALALAEGFNVGPASAVISPFVYYVNCKREINLESLKKGIKQRGFLPSVFIFDDCQEKSDLMIDIFESLTFFVDKKQVFCIFLFRTTLTNEERRDEDAELRDLFEPGAVIDYTIDDKFFREIASSFRPGLKSVDCRALLNLTGRDLFILDFILEKVDAEEDIEAWLKKEGRQTLYQKAVDKYFKGERRNLGAILGLLALAQFDIGILPGYIDCIYGSIKRGSMKEILDELVVTAGSPSRCFFLHSSLAELLCRAAINDLQQGSYIETVTPFAIEYLKHLADAGVDERDFNSFLANFITGELKLGEEENEEKKIKIKFFQDQGVITAVKNRFDRVVPNHIARILRLLEGEGAFEDYFAVLKEKIESNQYMETVIFFEGYVAHLMCRFLKEKYPGLFDRFKKTFYGENLKILCEKLNVKGLLNILADFFDEDDGDRLDQALGSLTDKDIEQIIERSIKEGRSIGTLSLGLRELQTKGLLKKWESKVSPGHYLRLIAANGTIFELIRFLEQSTSTRAVELIDGITVDYLEDLVEKTLASGRSIGTLHLGLRELHTKGLLQKWESKASPGHYLRLIAANGTIFELIMILKDSTASRASELIAGLMGDYSEDLVEKTLVSGRSIGTLDLGLRDLQKKGLLNKWESKVSPGHYLRLIAGNGTFVELISILRRSTKTMAGNLMQSITREWTAELIKNTIAKKPSLTSLPWGVQRLVRLCGGDTRLFDEKIGPDNLFHLIITIGSPGILVQVLDILPASPRQTLIQAFQVLPEEKRTGFILQGNFYHFCKAAVHYPRLIAVTGETGPDPGLLDAMITQAMDNRDFLFLNRGINFLEENSHFELMSLVPELLSRGLELLPLPKIHSVSNTDRANYLALLNRLEKLDAGTLQKIVQTINWKEYAREKYFFSSIRFLFHLLAVHDTGASQRLEILEIANDDLMAGILAKQELLPVFLYLWNTYALFITVKDKRQFNHWLNPDIKEGIFKMIKKNKDLHYSNPGYEHLLKLMGLLAYLDIQPSRLRSIFSPSYRPNTSRRFLGDKVEKLDFLPGCFFLLGVEFFPGKKVPSHYWDLVKEKKDRYKMQTATLRELIRAVSKGIN